jgi:hypothetical protein
MNDGIDEHAHGVPRQFLEEVKRTRLAGVDVASADGGGYVLTFPGCKPLRPAGGITLDFTQRLGWLDGQGMQQQLIGPWLDVHGQELPRFKNLCGRTIDTTITAAQLILAGVFDRYPKLRLVLVHGGGFLPYQTGRLDREFGEKGRKLPSDYVKQFYYDTVSMSAPALQMLFTLVGTGQVMIGSDYAAGPVERPGPKLTDAPDATGIGAAARKSIVRDTAEALFRTSAGARA